MTHFLAKIYFSLIRVLKSKKKKLALTLFYCLGQETWLDDSLKLIYINQSRFYNLFHVGDILKYFSIFNNKPPASWVVHIARYFLICYSCSCFKWSNLLVKKVHLYIENDQNTNGYGFLNCETLYYIR